MVDDTVQLYVDNDEEAKCDPIEKQTDRCIVTSPKLTEGVLSLYQGSLDEVRSNVKEVVRNQSVLRDLAQNELIQLKENIMITDMVKTFEDIKLYHKKLVSMKKEMLSLSNRMDKVKFRAQKLQGRKQKELLEAAQEKERQRNYEKELTAKPAVQNTQSS